MNFGVAGWGSVKQGEMERESVPHCTKCEGWLSQPVMAFSLWVYQGICWASTKASTYHSILLLQKASKAFRRIPKWTRIHTFL